MNPWAAALPFFLLASAYPGSQLVPDFAGRWRLVEQETSAWMGRSSTGAHEEDQLITQSESRLAVGYVGTDGTWDFARDASHRQWTSSVSASSSTSRTVRGPSCC